MATFWDIMHLLTGTPLVLVAIIGLTWGILGGALPGISASITMALVLPFTYTMDPAMAIALLACVYIGAEYGGSIPAILIRTPGTNSSAATVIDGYEMNRQGRAGEALGISLMSGVVGSLFGLAMLVLLTEPLSWLALLFTPASYFGLGILGLSVIASTSGGSLVKGLASAVIGLMISTVGTDPISGVTRFTFNAPDLLGGIEPVLVMVGLFALTELMSQSGSTSVMKLNASIRIKLPSLDLMNRLKRSQFIGCLLGLFEGLTPGGGGSIAAFMSYNEAKRWSKEPEKFGKGSEEGVAAPEAANNTVASTALIPLLSFGIPSSNSTAVLLGGLLMHGLIPGPRLFEQSAQVIDSIYVGSFIAIIAQIGIGMIILPACIWLVNRPRPYRAGFIFALILSGLYTLNNSTFDLGLALGLGLLGYFMRLTKFPVLPMILGVVLGHLVESSYRRSLVLSGGDLMVFLEDPIAVILLSLALIFVIFSLRREILEVRKSKLEEAHS
ncbi:tripartite tricarboxylate transporter permease [Rhizobium sp. TH2]|uniref:tripartite tricarboxylate transporter permease n=1 Tax=Rhizobium sp. TH2 TaxID=2775403 RepID=UPI0021583D89|nr:tripartite tricarboxylate transporter permease [Rhizobium sp. TH2]UVC08635.1 tripartite tricarboxylate transporter permease [Rhizobium sp. TH2]